MVVVPTMKLNGVHCCVHFIVWTKVVKTFFKISTFVKTDVRKSAVKSKMGQNNMEGTELESKRQNFLLKEK